jgi:hypothetical protein
MSQFNPRMAVGRPVNNVYTGLAFISMAVTLATMVYLLLRLVDLGVFK